MSINPRGAAFIGAAVALSVAGLLLIDGVLISLGAAAFLLILITSLFGHWNLSGLDIELLAPECVFADCPFDLHLTQRNSRQLFDAYSIELQLHLSKSATIHIHAPWTAARSSSNTKVRGSISKRGASAQHPCTLSSSFPLGLFCFTKNIVTLQEILVFPKPLIPKEFFTHGEFDDAWQGEGHQAGDAPGEPRGLRPYRPGDHAKQIHWPSTIRSLSRGHSPRVREYDPPGFRPREAALIFHSFGTDHTLIRTDLFERALSLVCGTLRHLRSIGIPTTLRADFLAWETQASFHATAWSETLGTLAHAQRATDTEAHDLTSQIETLPSEQALIIISDMPPEAWRHILPQRQALIVDIQQHRYGKKDLNIIPQPRKTPPSDSRHSEQRDLDAPLSSL